MSNGTIIFHVSEDYLAHHGILGQKWGKRNGPPYPLDEKDYSKREKQLKKDARKVRDAYNSYLTYEQIYEKANKTDVAKTVSTSENVLKAKKEYENATKAVREYNNLSDTEWKALRVRLATEWASEHPEEYEKIQKDANNASNRNPISFDDYIGAIARSDAFQNEQSAFSQFLKEKYHTNYKDYEKEFNTAQEKYKKVIEDEVKSIFNEVGDEVLEEINTYPAPIITTISDVQTDAIMESLEEHDNLWLPDF